MRIRVHALGMAFATVRNRHNRGVMSARTTPVIREISAEAPGERPSVLPEISGIFLKPSTGDAETRPTDAETRRTLEGLDRLTDARALIANACWTLERVVNGPAGAPQMIAARFRMAARTLDKAEDVAREGARLLGWNDLPRVSPTRPYPGLPEELGDAADARTLAATEIERLRGVHATIGAIAARREPLVPKAEASPIQRERPRLVMPWDGDRWSAAWWAFNVVLILTWLILELAG